MNNSEIKCLLCRSSDGHVKEILPEGFAATLDPRPKWFFVCKTCKSMSQIDPPGSAKDETTRN